MQFLKTLLWVLLAVVVALFASRNWQAGHARPVGRYPGRHQTAGSAVRSSFLIGFLPTWLTMRAKQWALTSRIEAMERTAGRRSAEAAPGTMPEEEPA